MEQTLGETVKTRETWYVGPGGVAESDTTFVTGTTNKDTVVAPQELIAIMA